MKNFIICIRPKNIIRQIKSKRMRWTVHAARMEEERKVYKVLVVHLAGNRPHRRPRRGREDWIRMDLREIGWVGVDSVGSGLVPVVGCYEGGDEPSGSGVTELVT
jgi:hypothetical protein